MKRKMIALALCSLMSSYACCGCNPAGNESKNQQTSSSQTSDAATAGIPEDVRAKLQAALDAPPIKLRADEWTEETVKDAIYISGEKLKEPLTLRDFGEGLEVRNDDTLTFHKGLAIGFFRYHGMDIATFAVKNCDSFEEIYDCPLTALNFYDLDGDNLMETNYPIAINGVSIGSSVDKANERLQFMELDTELANDKKGYYGYLYEGDTMNLVVSVINNKVNNINLDFEK